MGITAISDVIKRLDFLDGVGDGRYPGLDLHRVSVPAGACEVARGAKATVMFQNSEGRVVSVDCAQLARNLNRFAEISEKLPATKLLQAANRGEKKEVERIKAQVDANDFFVYHIVDHFISASLLGIAATDEPPSVVFNKLPVGAYVRNSNQLAANFGRPGSSPIQVPNVEAAFTLFQEAGKKYGFATEDFDPRKKGGPSSKPEVIKPVKGGAIDL